MSDATALAPPDAPTIEPVYANMLFFSLSAPLTFVSRFSRCESAGESGSYHVQLTSYRTH